MNEPDFTRAVHKRLSNTVWAWKINDNYMGGIPDAYYRSVNGGRELWVEYKYLKSLPKRANTKIVPALSALQLKMLNDTLQAKQQAVVIIGYESRGIVLENPEEWVQGVAVDTFIERLMGYHQLAGYIESKVLR
ncbi:hypothetical protein SAMN05660772_01881 [Pasteurella testudinis DSM 23072]|uniref:VRR-NUC domain-containing protein n=1 Tax=Pasteurella testudinis DSM 23072 TaxID=1122938 RepID=A0A1W1UKH6_9PAST|nr:hypothetical protein [Pasteurella testudinis]SMB81523.1 hypothetical protein SAMN05660772_01881 [Pasteurella testudinis DSM 23072]SUB51440.1 Uncharacterised protein [Pasteurella testudinis]